MAPANGYSYCIIQRSYTSLSYELSLWKLPTSRSCHCVLGLLESYRHHLATACLLSTFSKIYSVALTSQVHVIGFRGLGLAGLTWRDHMLLSDEFSLKPIEFQVVCHHILPQDAFPAGLRIAFVSRLRLRVAYAFERLG